MLRGRGSDGLRRLGRIPNPTTRCVRWRRIARRLWRQFQTPAQQTFRIDTDSDWQDWRSACLCVGGQRAQSMRRSLLCTVSRGSCQELCLTPMQHVLTLTMGVQLSKLAMLMHEDACRWQCWSVTITWMAISSRRWAELRLRGRVRAWIEACRVRASRCSKARQELS